MTDIFRTEMVRKANFLEASEKSGFRWKSARCQSMMA